MVEGYTRCLEVLHDHNYRFEEALEMLRCKPFAAGRRSWSNKEKAAFNKGIYAHGKQFKRLAVMVGGRSRGEVVGYYFGEWRYSDAHRQWKEYIRKKSLGELQALIVKEEEMPFLVQGMITAGDVGTPNACVWEGVWAHDEKGLAEGRVGKFRYHHVGGAHDDQAAAKAAVLKGKKDAEEKKKAEEAPRRSSRAEKRKAAEEEPNPQLVPAKEGKEKKPVAVSELPKAEWPPSGRYAGYFNLGGHKAARVEEKAVHVAWSADGQVEAIGEASICGIFGLRGSFEAKAGCGMRGQKWYLGGVAERPTLGPSSAQRRRP